MKKIRPTVDENGVGFCGEGQCPWAEKDYVPKISLNEKLYCKHPYFMGHKYMLAHKEIVCWPRMVQLMGLFYKNGTIAGEENFLGSCYYYVRDCLDGKWGKNE